MELEPFTGERRAKGEESQWMCLEEVLLVGKAYQLRAAQVVY